MVKRAGGSRQREKVKGRRDMRKRKLKDMARKGLRTKKQVGPHLGRGRNNYACGPCSESKGTQVSHRHNSEIGRRHYLADHGLAYTFPKPEKDKPKPLRGEKNAPDL